MDNSMRVHVKGKGRKMSRVIVRNRSSVEVHTPKGRVDIAIACINRLYVMEWKPILFSKRQCSELIFVTHYLVHVGCNTVKARINLANCLMLNMLPSFSHTLLPIGFSSSMIFLPNMFNWSLTELVDYGISYVYNVFQVVCKGLGEHLCAFIPKKMYVVFKVVGAVEIEATSMIIHKRNVTLYSEIFQYAVIRFVNLCKLRGNGKYQFYSIAFA